MKAIHGQLKSFFECENIRWTQGVIAPKGGHRIGAASRGMSSHIFHVYDFPCPEWMVRCLIMASIFVDSATCKTPSLLHLDGMSRGLAINYIVIQACEPRQNSPIVVAINLARSDVGFDAVWKIYLVRANRCKFVMFHPNFKTRSSRAILYPRPSIHNQRLYYPRKLPPT